MKPYYSVAFMALLLAGLLLGGCAAPAQPEMDVHAVWKQIENDLELPSMMELDEELLASLYENIPMEKIVKQEAHMAMINVHAAEVALFEATDANAAAEIKTAVESRQDALEQQWSLYLPDQYELVQNAIVEVNGKYVVFLIGNFAQDAKAIVDRALAA